MSNALLDEQSVESADAVAMAPPMQAAAADRPVASSAKQVAVRRVLHLINGEHYSGAERVQDLLGLCLPHFHYEVGFACLKPDRFPYLRRAEQSPLYEFPMRWKFDFAPAWRIARLVRSEGYDLIHTHTPRSAFIGQIAATLAGVPMVHHIHSPTSRDTTQPWRNRLNLATERVSLCRVGHVITVSRTLEQWAHTLGIPRWKISVVHNGVPATGELPSRPYPSSTWTLGTVALFRPRKGLEVLLEALATLRSQGLRVRLRAVGGFETPEYEALIKQLGERLCLTDAIDWLGFRQNVPAELAHMDLFVLPSLFGEGLPMVILEAMAAGVPVVATRVEGAPEAIRHELEGLLVEPGDPRSLADQIAAVMRGDIDWHELREAAHRRQSKCFSDESMAHGVARVYDKLLDSSPLSPCGRGAG
jgi:glycosyltransferase involved in cell wall biosynthesis